MSTKDNQVPADRNLTLLELLNIAATKHPLTDTHTIDIQVIESWRLEIEATSPEDALAQATQMKADAIREQGTLMSCETDYAELA
jgi:hypothetical protein